MTPSRQERRVTRACIAVLCFLSVACSTAESLGPGNNRALLPGNLKLVAEASSINASGKRINCGIETIVTLGSRIDRGETAVVQYGTGGGEASRYADKDGYAVQFSADTYFPDLEFHLIGVDSLEVRSPASTPVQERFWHEFAVFAGSSRNADPANGVLARGTWTCRPMDTPPSSGQYYDVDGIATGTWMLVVNEP
jgi:hypothetical protein